MKLLLVRHGESAWNVEGRYQGWLDPPLSELGVRQSRAIASRLADLERPGTVISSPQLRARQTAQPIADACGAGLTFDNRLMEICHGEWEGLQPDEVARRWPELFARWKTEPHTVRFPGGESLADVAGRWRSFADDLQATEAPLAIVTHDVVIRLACTEAEEVPITSFNSWANENGGITELELRDGALRLVTFNDTSHLAGLRAELSRQAL